MEEPHNKLNHQDPERFPLPDHPDLETFEASFTSLNGRVNVIIDEANNLSSIKASTLDTFVNILRELRHLHNSKGSGLGALIMVGTEELLSTLKKGDKTSPFNHVSSVLVHHLGQTSGTMVTCIAVLHITVFLLTTSISFRTSLLVYLDLGCLQDKRVNLPPQYCCVLLAYKSWYWI